MGQEARRGLHGGAGREGSAGGPPTRAGCRREGSGVLGAGVSPPREGPGSVRGASVPANVPRAAPKVPGLSSQGLGGDNQTVPRHPGFPRRVLDQLPTQTEMGAASSVKDDPQLTGSLGTLGAGDSVSRVAAGMTEGLGGVGTLGRVCN